MLFVEEKWKIERDRLIQNNIEDPRELVKSGNIIIENLYRQVYQNVQSSDLSLTCFFKNKNNYYAKIIKHDCWNM